LARTAEGELVSFGDGSSGQLGHGTEEDEFLPREVGLLANFNVCKVDTGCHHTVCCSSDGLCFTWGAGGDGRLGHAGVQGHGGGGELAPRAVEGLTGRKVVEVAAGAYHTAVLTVEGACYTFGVGEFGQLGLGEESLAVLPTKVDEHLSSSAGEEAGRL